MQSNVISKNLLLSILEVYALVHCTITVAYES